MYDRTRCCNLSPSKRLHSREQLLCMRRLKRRTDKRSCQNFQNAQMALNHIGILGYYCLCQQKYFRISDKLGECTSHFVCNNISKIMSSTTLLLTPTRNLTSGEYREEPCAHCYREELKQLYYGNRYEQLNRKYVKLTKIVHLSQNNNAR